MHEVKDEGTTVIRGACIHDAAAAGELLAALGYPSSIAQVKERIARSAESDDTAVFVAETHHQIVGLVSFHLIPLFHADGFLGRITSFIVAPMHRQRGIGRLLAAAVEEFAWAHGCMRVEVTSGDHRPDAHSFYERMGYDLDCRRFTKRRKDAYPDQMPPTAPSGSGSP